MRVRRVLKRTPGRARSHDLKSVLKTSCGNEWRVRVYNYIIGVCSFPRLLLKGEFTQCVERKDPFQHKELACKTYTNIPQHYFTLLEAATQLPTLSALNVLRQQTDT